MGHRTGIQIECPHIIGNLPTNTTTEYDKLGTDHGCGRVVTTVRSGTIDHDAGPLS